MRETATTLPDIASRADVVRLVDTFYDRIRADDLLGRVFDQVAKTDWSVHLPKMYSFWSAVLFGEPGFKGNPMAVHLDLARQTPLGPREFVRWIEVFHANVDANFTGPVATEAKARASRIADVMQQYLARHEAARQVAGPSDLVAWRSADELPGR